MSGNRRPDPSGTRRFESTLRSELFRYVVEVAVSWAPSVAAVHAGSVNVNVVPCPSVLSTQIRPPWRCTSSRQM